MSAAQVAKLEALLARVHSRRLEPGLRLVDAPVIDLHTADVSAAVSVEPDDLDLSVTARAPVAPVSGVGLLALDEPAVAAPSRQRVTMDVDLDMDDLVEVDAAPPAPGVDDLSEPEDAFVTAVARPAPVVPTAPVAPVAPVAAVVARVAPVAPPVAPAASVAPAPVAIAPVAVAPVAEVVPAPPSGLKSAGPIVMEAAPPVASGPVATFVGASQRTHALTFGELVGLAMSLTTR